MSPYKTLTEEDFDLILESLRHTEMRIEVYDKYPNKEFRLQRLNETRTLINKIRILKLKLKEEKNES